MLESNLHNTKPNLELAAFLKELLEKYDENKHEDVINSLSFKWKIEPEDIEFFLAGINSYYFRPIVKSMVASANYDENFMEVFRALDYINGKIDEDGNEKPAQRIKKTLFRFFISKFGWIFIVFITLVIVSLVKFILHFVFGLFSWN